MHIVKPFFLTLLHLGEGIFLRYTPRVDGANCCICAIVVTMQIA